MVWKGTVRPVRTSWTVPAIASACCRYTLITKLRGVGTSILLLGGDKVRAGPLRFAYGFASHEGISRWLAG